MYQYIKILLVCLSVCDGCGRGRNGFAGRVQNHRICGSCAKSSRAFQLSRLLIFLEIILKTAAKLYTAAGLDTLRCRLREGCHCALTITLATGKNTRLFGVLD